MVNAYSSHAGRPWWYALPGVIGMSSPPAWLAAQVTVMSRSCHGCSFQAWIRSVGSGRGAYPSWSMCRRMLGCIWMMAAAWAGSRVQASCRLSRSWARVFLSMPFMMVPFSGGASRGGGRRWCSVAAGECLGLVVGVPVGHACRAGGEGERVFVPCWSAVVERVAWGDVPFLGCPGGAPGVEAATGDLDAVEVDAAEVAESSAPYGS